MMTGFVQAYAAIVSQATRQDDDTDDSLTSWGCGQPVIPSDEEDDDIFLDEVTRKRGKKTGRKNNKYDWIVWSPGAEEYLYSDDDVNEALWTLASVEFRGKPANGVCLVKGTLRETKLKSIRRYNCPFFNCCSCTRLYQVVFYKAECRWQIEVAADTSNSHGNSRSGAMKQALLAWVDSPSKLQKPPKMLVGEATTKLGEKLTQSEQKQLRRRIGRRRIAHATSSLTNGGDGSHYGDVVDSLLNKYKRENISKFNWDSVYLLGDNVCVDGVTDKEGNESIRFYCVLSTENLLLNGPRQKSTGQALMLAVDGSYRYVHEKDHGLFVVKTINHCQSAKTIAYAICNREDKTALTWIFEAIKEETERIVNGLAQCEEPYM